MGKPRGGYIGFKEGGARVGKPRKEGGARVGKPRGGYIGKEGGARVGIYRIQRRRGPSGEA